MTTATIRWMLALAWLCLPTAGHADLLLAGRLTTTGAGLELEGGAETPSVSPDGRYVAFVSDSDNLGLPFNGSSNVYRYDLLTDTYDLATAAIGTGNSYAPSISEEGLAVAFQSEANDLASGTPSNVTDVFYSVANAEGPGVTFDTYLVSEGIGGVAPNGSSQNASISADGRWVVFQSNASNLVAGDSNGQPDIFIADANDLFATPQRVSVIGAGTQIEGPSRALSSQAISGDGRYVAFAVDTPISIDGSNAGTLEDVFVRDRQTGTTELVSKSTAGVAGTSSSDMAAISQSGRFVVFRSFSSLVASPTGSRIYLRDRQAGTTTNMALPPDVSSCEDPLVSDAGDILAQCSPFTGSPQVYLQQASDGSLFRLSTTPGDTAGNAISGNVMGISANGRIMVFDSDASDLVQGDMNSSPDVFVVVPEPGAASVGLAAVAALVGVARRRTSSR